MGEVKSVGQEIRMLVNLMKRRVHQVSGNLPEGMKSFTPMHGWIVSYLYERGDKDTFQKDIEQVFSIRKSTASKILTTMENNEIITRKSVTYDTRLKKIILTDKARDHYFTTCEHIKKLEKELTKSIPKEKLTIFFEVIDEIKQNIQQS